uniref:Uncharacterized protein n=1 Tax=Anguilla anguilla TaxID=7936 RepID=A0A0E9WHJ0_ANGAN
MVLFMYPFYQSPIYTRQKHSSQKREKVPTSLKKIKKHF